MSTGRNRIARSVKKVHDLFVPHKRETACLPLHNFGQHLSFAMPAIQWGERSEGVSPPGVPLEERVALPGTPVIKDGYLIPSNAPGFGIEVTKAWLEEKAKSDPR